jgi:hypothetical protein
VLPLPHADIALSPVAVEAGSNIETDRLMINSDTALYRAKSRGGNRAELFSKELEFQALEKSRVGEDILRGLESNEFISVRSNLSMMRSRLNSSALRLLSVGHIQQATFALPQAF